MTSKWPPADYTDIIDRYTAGDSIVALAQLCGVTRTTMTNCINRLATVGYLVRRTNAEQNRINNARRTPEERGRISEAGLAHWRGTKQTPELQAKYASLREQAQQIAPSESAVAAWLIARGHVIQHQTAIGAYNADITTGTVAVEIAGGDFHAWGRHAARHQKRMHYLLDAGWHVVVVWVTKIFKGRGPILTEAVAEYLHTFIDETSRNPSMVRQYRVIWGDGQEAARESAYIDQLTLKPTRNPSNSTRSTD